MHCTYIIYFQIDLRELSLIYCRPSKYCYQRRDSIFAEFISWFYSVIIQLTSVWYLLPVNHSSVIKSFILQRSPPKCFHQAIPRFSFQPTPAKQSGTELDHQRLLRVTSSILVKLSLRSALSASFSNTGNLIILSRLSISNVEIYL